MPRIDYRLADGTKVPGTTTIIGRFKDSKALLFWAFKRGKEGAERLYGDTSALDIGTAVHEAVEAYIRALPDGAAVAYDVGRSLLNGSGLAESLDGAPCDLDRAHNGLDAFLRWFDQTRIEIIATEVSLVCEQYRYGGTLDALGRTPDGRLVLLDWKTSKGIYPDHLVQLAAYTHLVHYGFRLDTHEPYPRGATIEEVHLCRVHKVDGSFHHHSWPMESVRMAWAYFVSVREAYGLDKRIREVV